MNRYKQVLTYLNIPLHTRMKQHFVFTHTLYHCIEIISQMHFIPCYTSILQKRETIHDFWPNEPW